MKHLAKTIQNINCWHSSNRCIYREMDDCVILCVCVCVCWISFHTAVVIQTVLSGLGELVLFQ